jgi:hypothetical protein
MSDDSTPKYERTQLQDALDPVIDQKLGDLGLSVPDLDVEHTRRLMRVLIRRAVRAGFRYKVDPNTFVQIVIECYAKEAGIDKAESPEEAQAILAAKFAGAAAGGSN